MSTSQPKTQPIDWRAAAIGDIEAAYRETADNHPGMLDPANPDFPKLLEEARTEALQLAEQTTTAGGYSATLRRFRSVLDDGHAGAADALPEEHRLPIRWPGFVAAWRGDAMYVYKSEADGPPEGAQITACDGKPIRDLIADNVFRYNTGRNVPGKWWVCARLAFVDDGNPFVQLPQRCTLQHNGQTFEHALTWRAVPEHCQTWTDGSANGERLPIGMTEPAPGLFWFAMPTFQPDKTETTAFQTMFKEVRVQREALLKARAIVIDLRFNCGGSSSWSSEFAGNLWGEARFKRHADHYHGDVEIWWRPTLGTLNALKRHLAHFKSINAPNIVQTLNEWLTPMEQAHAEGKPFMIPDEKSQNDGPALLTDLPTDEPALTTPVYVIVHGQCASAALDALDFFKLFPNTQLIGAPSSADSTYLDVRGAPTPSGMGHTIIPMKMWVGRPRGNGQYYLPDIPMTDLDWSTANFQRHIEADLKKTKEP